MKTLYQYCIQAFLLLSACSTIDLPSIEESQIKLDSLTLMLNATENLIKYKSKNIDHSSDLELTIKAEAFNKIFSAIANDRKDDLIITFLPTKPFIKEDKIILGLEYSNFINVDGGYVNMNLKSLKFIEMKGNKIKANIEIKGDGLIGLSGKYTGIPASVKSAVDLYINEDIQFGIRKSVNHDLVLYPLPQKLKLKTKFTISLGKCFLPWREEIDLDFADLLSDIPMPMSLAAVIKLPIPANDRANEFEHVNHNIDFYNIKFKTENNAVIWKADVNMMKSD